MIFERHIGLRGVLLLLSMVSAGCGGAASSGDGATTRESGQRVSASVKSSTGTERAGGKIPVIVTYSILGDWVSQVGGEHVSLTTLVGPGGDAHTYEPTPQDSVAVAEATLLFENGLGFEVWLDGLFEASGSTARRVVVTEGIRVREFSDERGNRETDPHVWHDPEFAIEMVAAVTEALIATDSAHSGDYRRNGAAYIRELQALKAWTDSQVTALSDSRRKLVTTHDTFGYFGERFGFQVSSVMGTVSSEVADPSAAQIASIVETIRREQVPAIFAENILNPQLTQQVAREAGVRVVPTLYTDALGEKGSDGESYIQMMRSNVTRIVESLK